MVRRPNPRGQNSPGGMPGQGIPDKRMPHAGVAAAGRTNVGFGGGRGMGTPYPANHQARRQLGEQVDPGFNVQPPGWHPPGGPGVPHKKGPGQQPGMQPPGAPAGFDYAAFNAWQDPNIGGQQPGPIQQGWGGFANTSDTMLKTKMNDYLNQQATGGARETMMNQLGYFNGGNPYVPKQPQRGPAFRNWVDEMGQSLGAIGGGTWQYMDPSGAGYLGTITDNAQMGGGQFRSLAPQVPDSGLRGNGRPNPRPNHSPGGMPNQGIPGNGGHGGNRPNRPGGGGHGGPGGQGGGGGAGGGGGQGGNGGGFLGFPQTPPAPPSFLPMTPEYEANRRAADDALAGTLQGLQNQQNLIDPMTQLQASRLGTDQRYATNSLMENLAERGIVGSGAGAYLYGRDIGTPYGREYQDLALNAGNQYGELMGQTGQAYQSYDAAMVEALLNRAAQAASELPLSLPQFYPPKGTQPYKNPSKRSRRRRRRNSGKKK